MPETIAKQPEQPSAYTLPDDIKAQIKEAFDSGEIDQDELKKVVDAMIEKNFIKDPENFNKLLNNLYEKQDEILKNTGNNVFKEGDGSEGGERWESRTEAIKEFTDFITDLTLKHAQATGNEKLATETRIAHDHFNSSEEQVHTTMLATKARLQNTLI